MKTPALVVLLALLSATAFAQTTTPRPAATPAPAATARPAATPHPATVETPGSRGTSPIVTQGPLNARAGGGVLSAGIPFKSKRVACKEVRLSWLAGDQLARGPETITIVKDEGGASGIQFFVDKAGAVTGVKTWSMAGGVTNAQTIPGLPKIDWVDCHDSEPIGGIWVEYLDATAFGP